MCGIFGYIGSRSDAASLVLEGLKLLEYRGYDSWGIAVKDGDTIANEKHVGKIGDATTNLPKSTIGIGHTRWATHGGVTKENSHPHLDCNKKIAVLHNGIIENYSELKEAVLASGHTYISETDTEVVPHMIEDAMKRLSFSEAVRTVFKKLTGLNAFLVLNTDTDEIVAVKNGSPLVVGFGKDELFVASDVTGIIDHTRKILFLEDQQMAILGHSFALLSTETGKKLQPDIQEITWKFEASEKGKYKHFLLKEIHEQPKVIRNIALNYNDQTKKLANLIDQAFGTFMLGCGTASYAALAGTYLFSSIAKKHINFSIGSEFNYLENYLTAKSLVIPITQSGETIDVVEPVMSAKKRGAKIAAVVNVLGSTIYRQADFSVLLGAGPEKAVVGTKSFIAMVAVLLQTAYTLVGKTKEAKELLLKAADNVDEILKDSYIEKIKNIAKKLQKKEHIYLLGRGLSYATAIEATLKIKETSYVHAEGFAGGELKHGVIALIEKGTPCFIFAPHDETYDAIVSNAQEVKARGGYIIGVGPKNHEVFDDFLETDDISHATIIPQVVIAQLLAYNLALIRGVADPDKPRNLAKSVTVK